ncbi:MAG: TIGR00180 family glycosyltransferase [Desulfovibrionaceae bacterium]
MRSAESGPSRTTLLVTCYERRWTLSRILKYYEGTAVRPLILDQSREPWAGKADHPGLRYVHYPAQDVLFYEMWLDALARHVDTPYVCWNNDDDFTTVRGLALAERALDERPDASTACGEMTQIGNERYGQAAFFRERPRLEDASHRVAHRFAELFANPHVLARGEVLATAARLVRESIAKGQAPLGCIRFWDKIFTFTAAVFGNDAVVPYLFGIRTIRRDTRSVYDEFPAREELEPGLPYRAILERLAVDNPLARLLRSREGMSPEEAEAATLDAFSRPGRHSVALPEELEQASPRRSPEGKGELRLVAEVVRAVPGPSQVRSE